MQEKETIEVMRVTREYEDPPDRCDVCGREKTVPVQSYIGGRGYRWTMVCPVEEHKYLKGGRGNG